MALCGIRKTTFLHCMKHCLSRRAMHEVTRLHFTEDHHNGITVDLEQVAPSVSDQDFHLLLQDSLKCWKNERRRAIWLQVPLSHSRLIAVAAGQGFTFHHAEGRAAMLKLWLDVSSGDMTPQFATHQIGASGFVVREDLKQVLVIKDRNSKFNLWKFPGGLSNLGEDIGDTAVREVYEETGVKTEFKSILAFRQQHQQPGAFGRSDIYVVCRLQPLTFELSPCSKEVKDCQWMSLTQLREEMARAPITKRLVDIVRYGLAEGFHNVDIVAEEMASVYKGLRYNIHHRPLPDKWKQ